MKSNIHSTLLSSSHEMIKPSQRLPVLFRRYEADNQFIPSHWHAHVEVLYLLEGTLHVAVNEQEYAIHTGDMFLVNSSDIHDTKAIGHINTVLLQIPYDYLDLFIPHFNLVHFQEYYSQKKLCGNEAFRTLINTLQLMNQVFEAKQKGYELLFVSHLHTFLYTLYTAFSTALLPSNQSHKNAGRIKEILVYINQHYQEPISLQDMAEQTSLNPEYFCRMFKRYTGTTLLEYINQVRLVHIHDELLETDQTITDILERNGFSNYKVFSRMFRDTYGNTPSVVRAQHLSTTITPTM